MRADFKLSHGESYGKLIIKRVHGCLSTAAFQKIIDKKQRIKNDDKKKQKQTKKRKNVLHHARFGKGI